MWFILATVGLILLIVSFMSRVMWKHLDGRVVEYKKSGVENLENQSRKERRFVFILGVTSLCGGACILIYAGYLFKQIIQN